MMMKLVMGGSGSGKSAYAEKCICRLYRELCTEDAGRDKEASLYYVADMIPYGQETAKKIEAHRKMRAGKGFATLEWSVDLPGTLSDPKAPILKGSCVLLECISNLTANEMYEPDGAENMGRDTAESVIKGVQMLKERCAHLVVVTNDVFRESVPDTEEMSAYKDNLGKINRVLAEMADRVTEVVYGVPVCIKSDSDIDAGTREQLKGIGAAEEIFNRLDVLRVTPRGVGRVTECYALSPFRDEAVAGAFRVYHCVGVKHFFLAEPLPKYLLARYSVERGYYHGIRPDELSRVA